MTKASKKKTGPKECSQCEIHECEVEEKKKEKKKKKKPAKNKSTEKSCNCMSDDYVICSDISDFTSPTEQECNKGSKPFCKTSEPVDSNKCRKPSNRRGERPKNCILINDTASDSMGGRTNSCNSKKQGVSFFSYPVYCNHDDDGCETCEDLISGLYCPDHFKEYEQSLQDICDKRGESVNNDCCRCLNDGITCPGTVTEEHISGCSCGDTCPSTLNYLRNKRKNVYTFNTAVERWRPGKMKICCPVCSAVDRPAIKQTKRTSLIAKTGLQATCLIGCWPFCILPFMMSQSNLFLFCKACKTYLGQYDKRKGCVKPPDPLKEQIAKMIFEC